jgi:maltose alpha-D-glucosyltransferase/alpha-amylase
MHMMFNFQVNQHLFFALASADARPLVEAMEATKSRPATAQWGTFLRNHDELDLGRLEEGQRQQVFAAFGPDLKMQLYDCGSGAGSRPCSVATVSGWSLPTVCCSHSPARR